MHYILPVYSHIFKFFGAVLGNSENCAALMRAGFPILVYPGGSREVMRKVNDTPYSLFWNDRTGFARMAIQHGYRIVPVASVGSDDMLAHIADIPGIDSLFTLVGWLMRWFGDKRVNQTFPLVIPRPFHLQRFYISSAPPIHTDHYNCDDCIVSFSLYVMFRKTRLPCAMRLGKHCWI